MSHKPTMYKVIFNVQYLYVFITICYFAEGNSQYAHNSKIKA